MSIYCSMSAIDGDNCPGEELVDLSFEPAAWEFDDVPENGDRAGKRYAAKTEPCTGCDVCEVGSPYVYEGSHVIVGPDSPRGGAVQWAVPAAHIPTASEPRDHVDETRWTAKHSYLRLAIDTADAVADIVLDRRQVAYLVAEWSRWLEGPFIDDGFPPAAGHHHPTTEDA